jgi:hypothetical protein
MCCWRFMSFQISRCVEWWIINGRFEGSWRLLLQGLIVLEMFRSFAKSIPISLALHPRRSDSVCQLWCLPSVYVRHLQLVMRSYVIHSPSGSSPWGFFLCGIEIFGTFMCSSWYSPAALYPVAMQPALLPGNGITRPLPYPRERLYSAFSCSPLLITLNWRF